MLTSALIFLLTVGAGICQGEEKGCKNDPADIVFVLDESGSIWGPHFTQQLNFVQNVIESLDVGFDRTHVGVITFGSTERVIFQLREFTEEAQMKAAVKAIKQQRGNTRTDLALRRTCEEMFSAQYSRPSVRHVAIVITDGESNYPNVTEKEAALCHEAGIQVFAIGVGMYIAKQELEAIATAKDFVYLVDSYGALDSLRIVLLYKVCPWSDESEKVCRDSAVDIIFALDESDSVYGADFTKQMDFVEGVIDSFDVGFNKTHFGVLTFATEVRTIFQLGQHADEDQLKAAVNETKQAGGKKYTHLALRYACEQMFSRNSSRPWVSRAVIVITNGDSDNPKETAKEAAFCRQKKILVLAIGVGRLISKKELEAIASIPYMVYAVDTHDTLQTLRIIVAWKVCPQNTQNIFGTNSTAKSTVCGNRPADIVFVLDESGYIYTKDFNKQLDFVQGVIDVFDVGINKTHIGVLAFSTKERVIFQLGKYTDEDGLKDAVKGITQERGQTNTHLALRRTCEEMFSRNYSRTWVSHVAIVVTDGISDYPNETAMEAASCHQLDIQVIVIGVGVGLSQKELDAIASLPHLVYKVKDYEELQTMRITDAWNVCPQNEQNIFGGAKSTEKTRNIVGTNSTAKPTDHTTVILVVVVTILFVVVISLVVGLFVVRMKSKGKPEANIQVDQRQRAASGVYDVIAYTVDDYDRIEDRDIDDDVPVKFLPRQDPLHPDPGYSSLLPEIPGKSDGYRNLKQFEMTGEEESENPRTMPSTDVDVASCDGNYIEMSRAKAAQETPSVANYTKLNANVAASDYHDTETYNVEDVNEQNCGEEDAPPYLELVND